MVVLRTGCENIRGLRTIWIPLDTRSLDLDVSSIGKTWISNAQTLDPIFDDDEYFHRTACREREAGNSANTKILISRSKFNIFGVETAVCLSQM